MSIRYLLSVMMLKILLHCWIMINGKYNMWLKPWWRLQSPSNKVITRGGLMHAMMHHNISWARWRGIQLLNGTNSSVQVQQKVFQCQDEGETKKQNCMEEINVTMHEKLGDEDFIANFKEIWLETSMVQKAMDYANEALGPMNVADLPGYNIQYPLSNVTVFHWLLQCGFWFQLLKKCYECDPCNQPDVVQDHIKYVTHNQGLELLETCWIQFKKYAIKSFVDYYEKQGVANTILEPKAKVLEELWETLYHSAEEDSSTDMIECHMNCFAESKILLNH